MPSQAEHDDSPTVELSTAVLITMGLMGEMGKTALNHIERLALCPKSYMYRYNTNHRLMAFCYTCALDGQLGWIKRNSDQCQMLREERYIFHTFKFDSDGLDLCVKSRANIFSQTFD